MRSALRKFFVFPFVRRFATRTTRIPLMASTAEEGAVVQRDEAPEGADDEDRLGFLKTSSFDVLEAMSDRILCTQCLGKRKFYCYDCERWLGKPEDKPRFKLPIKVEIIHHPAEKRSKSTAVHAKVLCPDDVDIHEFPDFPDFDPDEYVLAFPSKTAVSIKDLDPNSYKGVIFVDSQWQRANQVLSDERLFGLRHVKMDDYKTAFWRYQSVGPNCLATIEAIYYFLREYMQAKNGEYHGQIDDLLYFYAYQYRLIQNEYKKKQKNFKRIQGYVKVDGAAPPAADAKERSGSPAADGDS